MIRLINRLLYPILAIAYVADTLFASAVAEEKPYGGKCLYLNIDRSDAPEFQQELSLATGKLITFQEGQTNTTINVGPNLDD